jgi:NAD(P)-dependent dehydrogenase (short-subunit alcohol dehydrogenase family)
MNKALSMTIYKDLACRNVLLTGALGTLGQAQAHGLARQGANLFLLDRLPLEQGQLWATSLAEANGTVASYVQCDLDQLQAAQDKVKALSTACGGIDVLINNAAVIVNRPFEEVSLSDYEDQVRINSSAAFALTQAVVPGMKEKSYGKIINFCSLTLNGRWDGYVPYVASKGALYGLTKSLARELGRHGIRVNAISPGAVVSEAEVRVFGDKLEAYNGWILENQAIKQRILPEHIADVVCFLASTASDMVSGQNIGVDGGW